MDDPHERANRWTEKRFFEALYYLLLLGTAVVAFGRASTGRGNVLVFVRAAERMVSGQWITVREVDHFTYPPFFAFLSIPLTWPPLWLSKFLWAAVSLGVLVVALREIERIVRPTAPWAELLERGPAARHFALALAILLALQGTLAVYQNEQFDALVFLCAIAGVRALVEARPVRGGALLGVAAALKATPLLFLPYLLIKRSHRAALTMVAVVMALSMLPDVLFTPGSGRLFAVDWLAKIVFFHPAMTPFIDPTFSGNLAPGGGTNELNQSLGVLLERFFSEASTSPVKLVGLEASTVAVLRAAVFLSLFVPIAWLGSWKTSADRSPRTMLVYELSLLFPLMLLLSPMSSKSHFVALLFPGFLLAAHYQLRPTRKLGVVLLVIFVTGVLTGRALLGPLASWAYHAGAMTWATLVTYAALLWFFRRALSRA